MAPGTERRCDTCGELNPARAKFCLECGIAFETSAPSGALALVDRLPDQPIGSGGERRIVTVLFADLSGFTAYSEGSDVEDVKTIAQETAQRLGDIVVRYGGHVDKLIGDCVMAIWGAPVAFEDDPERAVRAALDMQDCVVEHQERFAGLALSVGLTTGEAMWSEVGGQYSVFGDTVNTAARLQGAAGKGEIVIGEPTYRTVADAIECDEMEPVKAKNKAEPVPAWRAVGVKGERTKHKPVVASLAGRTAESNRLRELWANTKDESKTYGVTIIGAAGVGKSRLVSALTDSVADEGIVLRGRCLPYGEGITYWPVIQIIETAAGIHHDDDRETVSQKLGALLEGLGSDDLDELRTMAVAIANLIGAPTTPRGTYSATEISRGELHWGLRRILERAAQIRPAVLVIEDLHWAEPTLLELLSFIFDSSASAPILGICTARPEFVESGAVLLEQKANRRVIELDALTEEAARAMIAELVGDDIPDDTVAALLRAAGGNPLFLEEIAQMWREGSTDDVPAGLQALIDSRLDSLPERERLIVTHASVVGETFWAGTIAHLESGAEGLAEALDSLERRDLVRTTASSTVTGEREYTFKHGLIRDAAYRRLTKVERAQLHRRCGGWIADLPGGQDEFAEIIAYHLEQACRIAADLSLTDAAAPMLDAARALKRASEKAQGRDGMVEAERFLVRAIDLLGSAYPETAIDAKLSRARILTGLGRIEEAADVMHDVVEGSSALGREDVRCRALLSLAEMQLQLGKADEAKDHLASGEALSRELSDRKLRVRALQLRGAILELVDGQPAAALDSLQAAIALAEEIEDHEAALYARLRLGVKAFNGGELEQAQFQFERCDELARAQGTLRIQSFLTAFIGLIRYHRGPREQANDLFAKAAEWLERTNDPYVRVQTLQWHAASLLAEGEVAGAVKLLREAETLASAFGGPIAVNVASAMAEAFARQGRVVEAREAAVVAREQAPEEDPLAQAGVLVAEAFAAAASGDAVAARRSFTQALPILDKQGKKIDLGDARLRLARLLVALGDASAAADQLERAREVFTEVRADATLDAIERELAQLRDAELASGAGSSLENA